MRAEMIWFREPSIPSSGVIAGEAPASQGEPDGRFKILNEPTRGRIVAYERQGLRPVAMTRSKPDGTWKIEGLNPDRILVVIGFDDNGQVNAAIQDWVRPHVPEP